MHKIGVIGDKDSVLLFRAFGMDVYPVNVQDTEENRKLLDRLAREEYGILFVTEQVAQTMTDTLDRYDKTSVPAVILIPSNAGSLGLGLLRVRKNVERAVGMNILD